MAAHGRVSTMVPRVGVIGAASGASLTTAKAPLDRSLTLEWRLAEPRSRRTVDLGEDTASRLGAVTLLVAPRCTVQAVCPERAKQRRAGSMVCVTVGSREPVALTPGVLFAAAPLEHPQTF